MSALHSTWLGCVPYEAAHALQVEMRNAVAIGAATATLLLLEHPPVITLGRRGESGDLLATPENLAARQIPVVQSERGGQATYHGPGQLVGYLIARARDLAPDLPTLIGGIEEAMIAVADQLGVTAQRDPRSSQGQSPRTPGRGVWAGEKKLGFVGIAVTHGVTWHGFALNVATDLSAFELIRPCGLDVAVTSIAAAGGNPTALPEAADMMATEVRRAFSLGRRPVGRGACPPPKRRCATNVAAGDKPPPYRNDGIGNGGIHDK